MSFIQSVHWRIEEFPSARPQQTSGYRLGTKIQCLPMMCRIFDITKYVVFSFSASEMECIEARLHLAYEVC